MNTNNFHITANALMGRYKRAVVNAQKRRLIRLSELNRIDGGHRPPPPHLVHLCNQIPPHARRWLP